MKNLNDEWFTQMNECIRLVQEAGELVKQGSYSDNPMDTGRACIMEAIGLLETAKSMLVDAMKGIQ